LQGNAVLEPGKSFLDFKPGMRLSSIMSIFMPLYEGEEPGFIMASHAQRLQKSACFIKSNNQNNNLEFTCITCHNPHVSVAKTRIEVFNNACANCHVQNTCSEIPEKLKMANNNCVSCHMPANTPSDIPHVTIHDHYIRKPILNKESTGKKRLIGLYSVNNPNPNNALKIKAYLSQYEKFERDNLLFLDSAEKLLIAGGRDNLEEWIRFVYLRNDYAALVQIAQSYSGKDAWTWYRIARANLLLNNLENALSAIKKAVDYKTNSLDFQNEYALILIQKKMFNQAIAVLNSLLTLQPKQARALTNRGFAYEQIGKTTLAVSDYKAALALDPDHGQARSNLKRLENQGFK
jgi:hypothetical protein